MWIPQTSPRLDRGGPRPTGSAPRLSQRPGRAWVAAPRDRVLSSRRHRHARPGRPGLRPVLRTTAPGRDAGGRSSRRASRPSTAAPTRSGPRPARARAQLAGRLRLELEEDAGSPASATGSSSTTRPARTAPPSSSASSSGARSSPAAPPAARRALQVVAANVDLVFAVCGLDADFNVRRIERYLARIWASGAQPAVILNKADLCEDAAARVAEVEGRCAGVPVLVTSALRSEGIEAVRALIHPGMTVALVGSSGAGKSTLVNALLGEERMPTGEVRAARRPRPPRHDPPPARPPPGRRPAARHAGHAGAAARRRGGARRRLRGHRGARRGAAASRDCRHDSEPGCAVREAVDVRSARRRTGWSTTGSSSARPRPTSCATTRGCGGRPGAFGGSSTTRSRGCGAGRAASPDRMLLSVPAHRGVR